MNLGSLSIATMILVIAAVSFPARGQSSLTQLENRVVSEYNGHYFCSQGMTSLTIRFLKPESGSQAVSIFEFGPSSANQSIPSGAFFLKPQIRNLSVLSLFAFGVILIVLLNVIPARRDSRRIRENKTGL